jgi:hypothetical protein
MQVHPLQVPVAEAVREAPAVGAALLELAAHHRASHQQVDSPQTIRHWDRLARSYCYQTHIAISGQGRERLPWLLNVLYSASSLPTQPWYSQFQGGACAPCGEKPQPGIAAHQLSLGCFDLGLPAPRCYRQLVSRTRLENDGCAIVARSIDSGPPLPAGTRLAYTLGPNGEVLYWEGECLHWHHICSTPGAGLLPPAPDRWLINTLRRLGLDRAERTTYRAEAEQMRDWLQSPLSEADYDING